MRIEVQNAATDWHTSQHSLIKFLTQIQAFDPDLIVVYHAINDLCRGFVPPQYCLRRRYMADYGHHLGPMIRVVRDHVSFDERGCLLFRRVAKQFRKYWFSDFRVEQPRPVQETRVGTWRSLPAFTRNMGNLVDCAKLANVDVLLASQPHLYRVDLTDDERRRIVFPKLFCEENRYVPDLGSMVEGMAAFERAVERIAQERSVPYIDLEALVPKTFDYFIDDVHYTPKGCAVIGNALADKVLELHLIDR